MKKPKTKRDAKAKQPRELDVAKLDTVQGGTGKRTDEDFQHNETFVRRQRGEEDTMKQPKAKRDPKAKQPRELAVAALATVQGGTGKRTDEDPQHNETFVRRRRAKRVR